MNDSVFLSQSYKDSQIDYERSLIRSGFPVWDYVVLTASNDEQAECFRIQIENRKVKGLLPKKTRFIVIPDENGVRVGSGGATLAVIRHIASIEKRSDFSGLRILCIHSGGDSKRVPQYSAMGKMFSPVPRELPNGAASTLFDEFMVCMSSMPGRIREGMLLLSGDVLLLFNPLLVDYSGKEAAAISFKADVETGKNHGVFLCGTEGKVKAFLHKQTSETLRRFGAVNECNAVDIDTGAVIFSIDMLKSLYSLVAEDADFSRLVNNTVRLSLYGDFLYPLAEDSSLEQFYLEKPEGTFCEELMQARKQVWHALRPYRMKLLRLAPAKFIHFGTTHEILDMMSSGVNAYNELGWSSCVNSSIVGKTAGYCSILSGRANIGKNCYLEVSYVHSDATVGDHTVLSYIDVHNETIPSNVVMHGLKQKDGRFVVRIYGIDDNPKDTIENGCSFLETTLQEFMTINKINESELWDVDDHSLWYARLYPACETIQDAIREALNVYEMSQGRGNPEQWRMAARKSLCSGFNDADSGALIAWEQRMQELVRMDSLAKLIRTGAPVTEAKMALQAKHLTAIQQEWLHRRISDADYSEALRLYYYVAKALGGAEGEEMMAQCFATISHAILENSLERLCVNHECRIKEDTYTVKLPLRVNWGGGWSDTPPYCNENGGTVLNAAILVNGEKPVDVTLTRIAEPRIIFDSRDMDSHAEFSEIEPLQRIGDPYDSFVLQKAALLACGVIPLKGGNLEDILKRMGGGFRMQTEVTNIPKGSGLGTSSILAAACVKAMLGFLGIDYLEEDLYERVLCMEQLMSTGGGWQDQIGGATNGIKYITSSPGLNQRMHIDYLRISEETMTELNERFALIYTGQRRLARNLLRDVVGSYIGNIAESKYALNEIQRVAALMRFELERGRVDSFSQLMNQHWDLSKMIDSDSTNTLIDQIFDSIDDLISGRMICGAGGGGFLQVILKKGVSREDVHNRLREIFQDSGIDVWDCTLI